MGIYINPGNESFATVRRGRYVDKSGLIAEVNRTLDMPTEKLSLISRPRRFGKSFAAKMLCAYYCTDCDSAALFADLEIANGTEEERAEYRKHLNQYNVLYLDITDVIGNAGISNMMPFIRDTVIKECKKLFPQAGDAAALNDMLINVVEATGKKFVALIDEWDAPVRDSASTSAIQKEYLEFLRSLFKSSGKTDRIFAAAYMTGILPIRKDGSQSAISEFQEYTILKPGSFAPYVGFSEEDVRTLCEETGMDFGEMKAWYDGYSFRDIKSVYNPNSVMRAIRSGYCESYWQMSSAADNLLYYVNMDYEGLASDVNELLGDKPVPVDVADFRNDPKDIRSRDDVITLLVHFGYLSYNEDSGLVRIPNEEIRREFARATRKMHHPDTIRRVKDFADEILLVGISYDKEDADKKHHCEIERCGI